MDSPLVFYAKMLGVLAVLTLVVGFNVAVWGLHRHPMPQVLYVPNADPIRGRALIERYGCGSCHVVPGIRSAVGEVGPRLDRLNRQTYIAGVLPNTPENMIVWIADPKTADPRTAMPDLGVTPEEARDIAAYLYRTR